ncbi:uncharacterized protein BDZ99DRAFT_401745 [Mytilinidion resinicola]|uniref:Uncharacterized protein n=1 Tax=Mytilinidion resinicola TaxID=574789 RepID=A0A6A6Y0E6_9PEZI|nr:uncharacterized protein BDZ99DRAFT_401745 [Mytilinidion resinicola]KAF2802242.1 hypothetical protein BDZ99DRAFT_401745 [Mytilinidion resinicola]
MFDSSLDRSKQYFIVLQLLRIMGEWISGALKDLEQQKGGWLQDQEYRKYAMIAFHERELRADPSRGVPELDEIDLEEKVISANWEALITYQRRHEKLLLDRIDKKTEEIKSLRDGVSHRRLFNATSVLETRKGTAINQYLFVFTVITIFYLPLSFVASIFGMHLFDSEDNHRTQASFYISTVLISILTYILSGFGAWWVGDSVRRQKLKRGWKSWTSKSAKDNEFPEVDLLVAEKNRGPVTPKEKKKTSRWSGLRSRKGKYGKDEEAQPPAPE